MPPQAALSQDFLHGRQSLAIQALLFGYLFYILFLCSILFIFGGNGGVEPASAGIFIKFLQACPNWNYEL